MSRRRQRERTVQRRALHWLARTYIRENKVQRLVAIEEADITRRERWWGRVDVLLAFEQPTGAVRTVAIEAKSSRLLPEVEGKVRCGTLLWLMVLAFGIGAGLPGSLVTSRYNGWLGILAGLFGGTVAGFVGLVVAGASPRFWSHAVVDQIERYPGTERWIVLAQDMMTDDLEETISTKCQANGIGLLVVPRRGEPTMMVKPRSSQPDDLLTHYSRAEQIRERLRNGQKGIHVKYRGRDDWALLTERA